MAIQIGHRSDDVGQQRSKSSAIHRQFPCEGTFLLMRTVENQHVVINMSSLDDTFQQGWPNIAKALDFIRRADFVGSGLGSAGSSALLGAQGAPMCLGNGCDQPSKRGVPRPDEMDQRREDQS